MGLLDPPGLTAAAADARFVHQDGKGLPADVVRTDADVPWAWSYPAETTEKVHFRIAPPTRAPFELVSWGSGLSDGSYDHWIGFGFNPQVFIDHSQGVSDEVAWFMGFEDGWLDPGNNRQGSEWYIAYYSPDHTSVDLFRPLYTRVQRNSNSDHSALTLLDIGTDGTGLFGVTAGSFAQIFAVTSDEVVFKPASGNGFLVLDAATGFAPFLQFRNGSVNGFYLVSPSVNVLRLDDKNSRLQAQFTRGDSAAEATTEFSSVLVAGSSIVAGAGPLDADATDGFVYFPTIAGPPTGEPRAFDGTVAFAFDTTDQLLRFNGSDGWRAVAPTDSPAFTGTVAFDGEVGFFGASPTSRPAVSGDTGGNAALQSLVAALAQLGLISDGTR